MKSDELELWNKIKSFQFDKPNISLTFAKRLAKENAISLQFAHQIVEEYRKFIFLCCVSSTDASPSHWIDQAWHLHLTYTKSYWIDLCKNTINRDIHHNPTEGGSAEDEKFGGLYRGTLELYELYFLSKPPAEIWSKENCPPTKNIPELEKQSNWIIPKPDFSIFRQKSWFFVISGLLFIAAVGCGARSGSLPIPLLVVFGGIVLVISFLFRNRNRRGRGGSGYASSCGSLGLSDTTESDSTDSGCSGDSSGSCSGDSTTGDTSGSSESSGGGESGCSSGSSCSSGCGGGGD